MVFSGLTFLLIFFPVVIILLLLNRDLRYQNGVLLGASLLFYGWGEPRWILAMIGVTLVNYVCAILFSRKRMRKVVKRVLLIIGIAASLGVLFYFKYAAFLINSINQLLGIHRTIPAAVLPIGISFYTFQALTYTVDVYRGKSPVQRNFFKLLLYISCFPQLIAGPIVQYSDIVAQIDDRKITMKGFTAGMPRFITGLAKKAILANFCGMVLNTLGTAETGPLTVIGAWFGAITYSLQIYFDFSAYSDMAIGMGRMLGFTYKENFNYPYAADSVTDFWRRWHISLGSFFRDYVYIPLGGNRVRPLRHALNLMIVWGLTGLWHGASWNFVCWGLMYGVLLLFEKFVLGKALYRIPSGIRRCFTLFFVMVGWVLFYYVDMSDGITHVLALFGLSSKGDTLALIDEKTGLLLLKYGLPILLACVLSTPLCHHLAAVYRQRNKERRCGYYLVSTTLLLALLALSIIFLIGQSYNPFIYFRF